MRSYRSFSEKATRCSWKSGPDAPAVSRMVTLYITHSAAASYDEMPAVGHPELGGRPRRWRTAQPWYLLSPRLRPVSPRLRLYLDTV